MNEKWGEWFSVGGRSQAGPLEKPALQAPDVSGCPGGCCKNSVSLSFVPPALGEGLVQ